MKRILISPGVEFVIGENIFANDISIMVTQEQIDKSIKTICYLNNKEGKLLQQALNEIFK